MPRRRTLAIVFSALAVIVGLVTSAPAFAISSKDTPAYSIALFDSSGVLQSSFSQGLGFFNNTVTPNLQGMIYSIARETSGDIIVGGMFQWYNGTNIGNVVRLKPDGSVDQDFVTNAEGGFNAFGNVNSVALQSDGKILLAGQFDVFGTTTIKQGSNYGNLIRLNQDGSLDTSFNPYVGGSTGSKVMIDPQDSTKAFLQVGLVVKRFDLTTGTLDTSYKLTREGGGEANAYRFTMQPDGKIVAVTTYNAIDSVRRFNRDGSIDNTWVDESYYGIYYGTITRGGPVFTLEVDSAGKVYLGGYFNSVQTSATTPSADKSGYANIARLNSDGTADVSFKPQFNLTVSAIYPLSDGSIVVGGDFSLVNSVTHHAIALIDSTGQLLPNHVNTDDGFGSISDPPTVKTIVSDGGTGFWTGGFFGLFQGLSDRLPTVSFDANLGFGGGSQSMDSVTADVSGDVTLPDNTFNRPGYEFAGWTTNPDGTGDLYQPGDIISLTDDLPLYAKWILVDSASTDVLPVTGFSTSAAPVWVGFSTLVIGATIVVIRRRRRSASR